MGRTDFVCYYNGLLNNYMPLLFATILPFVVILSAFLGDLLLANDVGWSTKSIGVIIREIVTISAYYYLLKEGVLKKVK